MTKKYIKEVKACQNHFLTAYEIEQDEDLLQNLEYREECKFWESFGE